MKYFFFRKFKCWIRLFHTIYGYCAKKSDRKHLGCLVSIILERECFGKKYNPACTSTLLFAIFFFKVSTDQNFFNAVPRPTSWTKTIMSKKRVILWAMNDSINSHTLFERLDLSRPLFCLSEQNGVSEQSKLTPF